MKNISEFIKESKFVRSEDYSDLGFECIGCCNNIDNIIDEFKGCMPKQLNSYVIDCEINKYAKGQVFVYFKENSKFKTIMPYMKKWISEFNRLEIEDGNKVILIARIIGDINRSYYKDPESSGMWKNDEDGTIQENSAILNFKCYRKR